MISFSERAVVPSHVLIRFLEQESVLLNLETERYFGLDAVGTRMWQLATTAPTVETALAQLVEEYDAGRPVHPSAVYDALEPVEVP